MGVRVGVWVGEVGATVVGVDVGAVVGIQVVGESVGDVDGDCVGLDVGCSVQPEEEYGSPICKLLSHAHAAFCVAVPAMYTVPGPHALSET